MMEILRLKIKARKLVQLAFPTHTTSLSHLVCPLLLLSHKDARRTLMREKSEIGLGSD